MTDAQPGDPGRRSWRKRHPRLFWSLCIALVWCVAAAYSVVTKKPPPEWPPRSPEKAAATASETASAPTLE